ncbi:unnamed protein product [Amoebophrya sp. A25]|nr:unnamed protein product [Amoebophrya sp. A25]|eukprot:GSA25T00026355001.1
MFSGENNTADHGTVGPHQHGNTVYYFDTTTGDYYALDQATGEYYYLVTVDHSAGRTSGDQHDNNVEAGVKGTTAEAAEDTTSAAAGEHQWQRRVVRQSVKGRLVKMENTDTFTGAPPKRGSEHKHPVSRVSLSKNTEQSEKVDHSGTMFVMDHSVHTVEDISSPLPEQSAASGTSSAGAARPSSSGGSPLTGRRVSESRHPKPRVVTSPSVKHESMKPELGGVAPDQAGATVHEVEHSTVPAFGTATAFSPSSRGNKKKMNALLFGTGEYVTGFTQVGGSKSDKSIGVVGVVHFDLRERGLLGPRIGLCGTNGDKFDAIRKHFAEKITFAGMRTHFEQYPGKGIRSADAYKEALKAFSPGDVCSVFTPDDTHFDITMAALDAGLHCMVTKPIVKSLSEHLQLVKKAQEKNVLLQIEVHKRFDPIYNDARMRVQKLGDFNFFTSYMSQPKFQLQTFKAWAGIGSDISYYLNSHHIDLHVWMMQGKSRCTSVRACKSEGVAEKILDRPCEDTITLMATWENFPSGSGGSIKSTGHATYTASWTAAKSDVHSQQRFFCLMSEGEVTADQCHRGYTLAGDDTNGVQSLNPLYIRNVPDSQNRYCGQHGYGYVSFQRFVEAASQINAGERKASDFDTDLPTGRMTLLVTAILEAGKKSLDAGGKQIGLRYDSATGDVCGFVE